MKFKWIVAGFYFFLICRISFAQTQPVRPSDNDAGINTGGSASSEAGKLLHPPTYEECLQSSRPVITHTNIYHDGWIDLNKNDKKDIYEDSTQPVEKRIDNLISQMTLEEKTAQTATLYGYDRVLKDYLPTRDWPNAFWKDGVANIDEHLNGYPYGNTDLPGTAYIWPASKHAWALNEVQRFFIEDTRLGVPAEFTDEGIRGVESFKATCFPTQLGLGQTWDRDLIRQVGEITGSEAYALGYANVYAPIMDVLRDPRWGRCEETYGEDPFLVSELAIQMVRGMQSQKIVSTMKHFCIYSSDNGAREGSARTDPHCTPREVEMIHLWPYERVIREANPLGVMASYNDYDGVPIESSYHFLTEVLRNRMGFNGYVVSDSGTVGFLESKYHVAETYKEAVRQSVIAGLNVRTDFKSPDSYVKPLRELVREGTVPMAVLDQRVREVLRVKFWEGLFDQPYRPMTNADAQVLSAHNVEISRQASREGLVLLKNDNHLLPLNAAKIKTIALCGPNADNPNYAEGHYGPGFPPVVTVRQALLERFAGKADILYAKGCDFFDATWPDTEIMWEPPTAQEQGELDEAVANAKQADVVIVVVGDMPRGRPDIRSTVGEDSSRTGLSLTGRQDDLIKAVAAAGKPVIVVDISGRPVALNWANRLCPAILQVFFPGMEGGHAIVEALLGDYDPGGKLTCTFPKTTGQLEMNFPNKPAANVEPTGTNRVNVAGVLWPFGYGLSYTTFRYSDLAIDPKEQKPDGSVIVSFKLTNTGSREGDEIPQLYTHQELGSVTTWEKRLCGFERVHLRPGESKIISFTIAPENLSIWNLEMKYLVEPGAFKAMVGASSTDIRLTGQFEVIRPESAAGVTKLSSDKTLAATPPMGWNSWNTFGVDVNETVVRGVADRLVALGLKDLGYKYIVIDDHWEGGRDQQGRILANPNKFPSGFKALADYVHGKGLKTGIYSCAGDQTCGGEVGSYGFEESDAATWASWGVDYVKYDYCNAPAQYDEAIRRYTRMGDALKATGQPIVFSLCEWGARSPWLWGRKAGGNLWRTSFDVGDLWDTPYNDHSLIGILPAIDASVNLGKFAGPGGWNDPDMLVVGLHNKGNIKGGGCTTAEYQTQMSMWCMLAAPLMIGCDVREMDAETLRILSNPEAIAIDQDALGIQGKRVARTGSTDIWKKSLADGSMAVALLNRGGKTDAITINWEDLRVKPGTPLKFRDVWEHKDLGTFSGSFTANVGSHVTLMLRVAPQKRLQEIGK